MATLRERVYQVFGSQVLEDLVEIGVRERELFAAAAERAALARPSPNSRREPDEPPTRRFRLTGFFSRPQVQKGNRNSIFIFVNGRLIRDRLLLHALSSAYHNLMPPAAYPFALLFLECDAGGGGRQRASVEDRGALPARLVRARFRARHHPRAADGEPARAHVFAGAARRRPAGSPPRACRIPSSAR